MAYLNGIACRFCPDTLLSQFFRKNIIMTTMRPKLKSDTFYIPLADGVYLRNNQGSYKIKGKVMYRWIEKLAPYLDGQRTLAEITDGLDEER